MGAVVEDDLILMAENEEGLCEKIMKWKSGMEVLKMNIKNKNDVCL